MQQYKHQSFQPNYVQQQQELQHHRQILHHQRIRHRQQQYPYSPYQQYQSYQTSAFLTEEKCYNKQLKQEIDLTLNTFSHEMTFHETELLVYGYLRDVNENLTDLIFLIPTDIIKLCFKFYSLAKIKRLWKEMNEYKYRLMMDWLTESGAVFQNFETKQRYGVFANRDLTVKDTRLCYIPLYVT